MIHVLYVDIATNSRLFWWFWNRKITTFTDPPNPSNLESWWCCLLAWQAVSENRTKVSAVRWGTIWLPSLGWCTIWNTLFSSKNECLSRTDPALFGVRHQWVWPWVLNNPIYLGCQPPKFRTEGTKTHGQSWSHVPSPCFFGGSMHILTCF